MQHDLFSTDEPQEYTLGPQSVLLRGFASSRADQLLAGVQTVTANAPFRHMETPGGFRMSVAMTSCGEFGWVTDRTGYRYAASDPVSGNPWPRMPEIFTQIAQEAAARAGFAHFQPDACLINCYVPGARLSLHQDKDEKDLQAPVVSVSLGLPAIFQFGGMTRSSKCDKVPLEHGDLVVWGGVDRLRYHGVLALKPGCHSSVGERRINLTFRKSQE